MLFHLSQSNRAVDAELVQSLYESSDLNMLLVLLSHPGITINLESNPEFKTKIAGLINPLLNIVWKFINQTEATTLNRERLVNNLAALQIDDEILASDLDNLHNLLKASAFQNDPPEETKILLAKVANKLMAAWDIPTIVEKAVDVQKTKAGKKGNALTENAIQLMTHDFYQQSSRDIQNQFLTLIGIPGLLDYQLTQPEQATILAEKINGILQYFSTSFFRDFAKSIWKDNRRTCNKDSIVWLLNLNVFRQCEFSKKDSVTTQDMLFLLMEINDIEFLDIFYALIIDHTNNALSKSKKQQKTENNSSSEKQQETEDNSPPEYELSLMSQIVGNKPKLHTLYLVVEHNQIKYRTSFTPGSDSILLENDILQQSEELHSAINEGNFTKVTPSCKKVLLDVISKKGFAPQIAIASIINNSAYGAKKTYAKEDEKALALRTQRIYDSIKRFISHPNAEIDVLTKYAGQAFCDLPCVQMSQKIHQIISAQMAEELISCDYSSTSFDEDILYDALSRRYTLMLCDQVTNTHKMIEQESFQELMELKHEKIFKLVKHMSVEKRNLLFKNNDFTNFLLGYRIQAMQKAIEKETIKGKKRDKITFLETVRALLKAEAILKANNVVAEPRTLTITQLAYIACHNEPCKKLIQKLYDQHDATTILAVKKMLLDSIPTNISAEQGNADTWLQTSVLGSLSKTTETLTYLSGEQLQEIFHGSTLQSRFLPDTASPVTSMARTSSTPSPLANLSRWARFSLSTPSSASEAQRLLLGNSTPGNT